MTSSLRQDAQARSDSWSWPVLSLSAYDRTPFLQEQEQAELDRIFLTPCVSIHERSHHILHRLIQPVQDVLSSIGLTRQALRVKTIRFVLAEIHKHHSTFWTWTLEEGRESICESNKVFYEMNPSTLCLVLKPGFPFRTVGARLLLIERELPSLPCSTRRKIPWISFRFKSIWDTKFSPQRSITHRLTQQSSPLMLQKPTILSKIWQRLRCSLIRRLS